LLNRIWAAHPLRNKQIYMMQLFDDLRWLWPGRTLLFIQDPLVRINRGPAVPGSTTTGLPVLMSSEPGSAAIAQVYRIGNSRKFLIPLVDATTRWRSYKHDQYDAQGAAARHA
jgi:hypothetical protein